MTRGPPLEPGWLKGRTLIIGTDRPFRRPEPPQQVGMPDDIVQLAREMARRGIDEQVVMSPPDGENRPMPGARYELLMAFFGWIWIGATIAVLVLAGLAIFAGWSWWNAGYALITSLLAKWLATGFRDNHRRVLFEHEMIASDMTTEEASAAWLENYGRR